ncbi:MAG: MarR family transcriptional regulator [Actinomycetota bacterium]|nr:MarR family transcriptional regulator [Actinomycetota bacterium]
MPQAQADLPHPTESGIDDVTGAVLTASRLLVAVSARSIADVDETITLSQFRLLVILHSRGTQKLTALAAILGVNPSTATRSVDRLVISGKVDRRINPRSRRETQISLTAAGTWLVSEVTSRRRHEIARIVAAMPPAGRNGLVDALTAFTAAGGEPPAAISPYDAGDTDWA